MVSGATSSYSVFPIYYILIDIFLMFPICIFLIIKANFINNLLLITAVVCQSSILIQALYNSKQRIQAIVFDEQLKDEIKKHMETKKELKFLQIMTPLQSCLTFGTLGLS